ncbi:helix-turn-helix domain-containing protein [Kutzneria sp. CA-103260]|uniref:helix-turn-helix domain-containing protein n=1 Tax=Kutzneria sp. CA-103260 TaxID=2802641 RepID=UPI001BAE0670|nr:helix-turn-helix transcriptional regulator [Kutzneria sp. CA-103260]QUQ69771.1 XRE family transcriptional regulator [Kutzneria sp. CA-103260]
MGSAAVAAYRELLGAVLRSCREKAGMSPTQATKLLSWYSSVKIARLEAGAIKVPADELERMLALFQVPAGEAEKIRFFGEKARERPSRMTASESAFRAYVAEASEISTYADQLLPDLTQTVDYANALLGTSLRTAPSDVGRETRERVEAQRPLTAATPPELRIVVGEPALLRPVGGRVVLRMQLEHLRGLVERPNVTFQVILIDHGEHAALGLPFTMITMAVPAFTTVYTEGLTAVSYADAPDEVDAYRLAFRRLTEAALPAEDSAKLLDRRIDELVQ